MSGHRLSALFTWRSAIASQQSKLPASARLVALVLSLHMSEKGDSAFPGFARLARETGLDRRTVIRQIKKLRKDGWLELLERGGPKAGKRGGRANVYRAVVPRWWHGDTTPGGDSGTGPLEVVAGVQRGSGTVPPQDVIEGDIEDATRGGGSIDVEQLEAALGRLRLTRKQTARARAAFGENPAGVLRCAEQALNDGQNPSALFAHLIEVGAWQDGPEPARPRSSGPYAVDAMSLESDRLERVGVFTTRDEAEAERAKHEDAVLYPLEGTRA
jgi:hypothetical protein